MTTNNRHYLFSKWRAVVWRAPPSQNDNYNWWASLKWVRILARNLWGINRTAVAKVNVSNVRSVHRCAPSNNFSTIPQKIAMHWIIRFPYGSRFASNHLPTVSPLKSVREIDIKNRLRIVSPMVRIWYGRIFNPILIIVRTRRALLFILLPCLCLPN